MNRKTFLATYRAELLASYDWSKDPAKLDRYMASVEATVSGEAKTWNASGPSLDSAWRKIGGKGKPTLKALRAMPVE